MLPSAEATYLVQPFRLVAGGGWNSPDMAWTTLQYSKKQVNAAGAALLDIPVMKAERREIMEVVNNWRSIHSYPLQATKMTLLQRAGKVDSRAIVAQRLKRTESIETKLRRPENVNMKLSQIHDIGGCRAVMPNVGAVEELVRVYERRRKKDTSDFVRAYPYIDCPKLDGYRGIHLVYRYRSLSEKHSVYNGLKIEVQLRSRLQHAWATAVETVDTLTQQALKSNIGDSTWKRFFQLMGAVIARSEQRQSVPGTPTSESALTAELRGLVSDLKIDDVLTGWGKAVPSFAGRKNYMPDDFLLLILDPIERKVRIVRYDRTQSAAAENACLQAEEDARDTPRQVVLVSVAKLRELPRAFPNYYLDSRAFVRLVREAVN